MEEGDDAALFMWLGNLDVSIFWSSNAGRAFRVDMRR
jgi:hypothetical protein